MTQKLRLQFVERKTNPEEIKKTWQRSDIRIILRFICQKSNIMGNIDQIPAMIKVGSKGLGKALASVRKPWF
jgi:hypothetical protein